jgi:hypothetical protein
MSKEEETTFHKIESCRWLFVGAMDKEPVISVSDLSQGGLGPILILKLSGQ